MFKNINLSYFLNTVQSKGKIVYEYNPLRNFKLSEDTYINDTLIPAGSIVDFDTDQLNFSLNNPVDIQTQNSYDGSVNLILNDNRNIPRLINSRFSVLQNNTYEVVDRIGNNDTNIYNQDELDLDTSLYKRVNTIPTIQFLGVLNYGSLRVGNYVLYIKYADADDNESDFVGETGIITCFVGTDSTPFSIDGGFRDQNAYKSINLFISDIDNSYDYLKIYYTRSTSDVQQNRVVQAYKINNKYPVINNKCSIIINGEEDIQEISLEEINTQYFVIDKAKTQAQCQNMLFLGNVNKAEPDHADLQDISLRMLPYLNKENAEDIIGNLDYNYTDNSISLNRFEYYNTNNIYYRVGYWNEEYYRLGVVYILNNGSLSPVYNIRGIDNIPTIDHISSYTFEHYDLFDNGTRQFIPVEDTTYRIGNNNNYENSKGVIHLNDLSQNSVQQLYSIGVYIPDEVVNYLKGKVQGLFFVRQKRIPTILTQMLVLPMDNESKLPVFKYDGNDSNVLERFMNNDRSIVQDYQSRLININQVSQSQYAGICPEYYLKQEYFNSLFTGIQFTVKKTQLYANSLYRSVYNDRVYYYDPSTLNVDTNTYNVNIITVPDNIQAVAIEDSIFKARAGEAEEAYKFSYANNENKVTESSNLVRGSFSAYLGISGQLDPYYVYNIYVPGYSSNVSTLFDIRYQDHSAYYAISDRISISNILNKYTISNIEKSAGHSIILYRGDRYICNFTHRLNRNFQDPEGPTNDVIVDENTWRDNYSYGEGEKNQNINRGDVNAVKLGSWITFKVDTSTNISIRSSDPSNSDEEALTGIKRSFYPLRAMSTEGNTKIPDSCVYNNGYSSTVGEKYQFTLPDVPYLKNRYETRIVYSDIAIGDAFKNGYRVFDLTHYRDYSSIYGGIMRLIELRGNLVCIFEHGIALIPVNERAVAGEGTGGNVYINTSNVLPQNPKIISDTFGTQWPESIIKTPLGVYGVDTVAKKIWRTNGETFECISDFKVQEFLNNNISLTERELIPIIGVRNVKTHYNKFKQDVMFTFYDNLYGFEEKAWNLCYNELLQKWVTFYSWIPSYSENIYNQFFSFDRNTSKWITKLGTSNTGNTISDGVTLSNNIIPNNAENGHKIGILSLSNRSLPPENLYSISFELLRDNYQNYKNFEIKNENGTYYLYLRTEAVNLCSELYQRNIQTYRASKIGTSDQSIIVTSDNQVLGTSRYQQSNNKITSLEGSSLVKWKQHIKDGDYLEIITNDRGLRQVLDKPYNQDKIVILLNIRANITFKEKGIMTAEEAAYVDSYKNSINIEGQYYESTVAVIVKYNQQFLTTDFWKHGKSGIIDISEKIQPTYWYGKQHPFEFEFVVADNPQVHKIFDNLQIISNNAEPESFHYEIVGDVYDFAKDKKNMYIRQEATKELYQYNGCDITYDHDYNNLSPVHRPLLDDHGNVIQGKYDKSTIMPLHYSRQDTINDIEDAYHLKDGSPIKDFSALAGGEIVKYDTLDEYRIWNHAKAVDVQKQGRLRGNMQYNEDQWLVQINPINVVYKNEKDWNTGDLIGGRTLSPNKIPIELGQSPVPNEVLEKGDIIYDPNDPTKGDIPTNSIDRAIVSWDWKESQMQEVKIKDKWVKIRIRYTGNKLAVITAIKTLYSISYA